MVTDSGGGSWVAREYSMYVFLRLVVGFTLLWAVLGSFLFGALLDYLGWARLSLEVKVSLFIGLSISVATLATLLAVGIWILIRRIVRS